MNNILDSIQKRLTKIQPVLVWLIIAYPAYRVIVNGIRKFDPEGMWTGAFEEWGYPVWFRIFIGVLETLGGLIILIPRTRAYGGIILGVVMIGALVTRLINGTGLDDALSIVFYIAVFFFAASKQVKS